MKNLLGFSEAGITSLVWTLKKKVWSQGRCKVICAIAVFVANLFKNVATVVIEGLKTTPFGSQNESPAAPKTAKNV
jgi:hypothetical protein